MQTLNRSAYLVLGMISAGFTTGYEISKHAEIASRFFWAAGDGQVYPQLKKLAAAGMIDSAAERRGKRTRHVYALTSEGRQALRAWLLSTAVCMWELRDEGLLKLFFSAGLTAGELLIRIDVIRALHVDAVRRLKEIEPIAAEHLPALLAQRHGLALHQAAIDWCESVSGAIDTVNPDAPSEAALRAALAA